MNNNKYLIIASLLLSFTLSNTAHACTTTESEPNNLESQANVIDCAKTTIAGKSKSGDIDWFSFSTSENGEISIRLEHNRRNDFDWALYGESGSAILTGESSNVPELGSINVTAGNYYVKVTRYSGRGWYDLNVDFPTEPTSPAEDCGYGSMPAIPSDLTYWQTGNANDACGALTSGQGATLLMGGGTDVDDAFTGRVLPHIGPNQDVVILRTSGSDGYNDYLSGLLNADSVNTLLVDSRSLANSDYVTWAVKSAEFVFIAGGDQADYLNQWQNTLLQESLQHVYDKGGVIGGTSAGMALLGGSVYDPDGVLGAISDEVVNDFCDETINISQGMFRNNLLANILTDTHFAERDRLARSVVFLGHLAAGSSVIAADENTSLYVKSNGDSVVDGSGAVYIFKETSSTERQQLNCNMPVIYNNIERLKLTVNQQVNLNTGSNTGETRSVSIDGTRNRYYSPRNPY